MNATPLPAIETFDAAYTDRDGNRIARDYYLMGDTHLAEVTEDSTAEFATWRVLINDKPVNSDTITSEAPLINITNYQLAQRKARIELRRTYRLAAIQE